MGRYNPNLPHILGQEWVPIREEDVAFAPDLATVEIGHRFTSLTSNNVTEGRYYINDPEAYGLADGQYFGINVYQAGNENETGPVRRVVIPCSAAGVTGDPIFVSAAADWPLAVFNPTDNNFGTAYVGGTTACRVRLFFGVNNFIQTLSGKRILGVNFLYTLASGGRDLPNLPQWTRALTISLKKETNNTLITLGTISNAGVADFPYDNSLSVAATVFSRGIGEVSRFGGFFTATPWTFPELQRFEITHGARTFIEFNSTTDTASNQVDYSVGYAALEVFYCEENRVAAGTAFNALPSSLTGENILTNVIPMADPVTLVSPVTLPAGDYTVTLAALDGGVYSNLTPLPTIQMNGVRQLYPIRPHKGIQINHPFPLDTTALGESFTSEEVQVLPQISLHTSTAPVLDVHAYGRQAVAQVYGNVTATQDIFDSGIGGTFSYPYIRFYARRWGNTTVPLRVSSASPTVSGSGVNVFITPDQFDDLAPAGGIIDGWKEVTLRFPTAPTMGFGTVPRWDFSASGELAGNRWEILGAAAPAISGVPNNSLQLWPTTGQRLDAATYGQPVSGSPVNLAWVPGISPMVSATTDDPMSDAALLFSQDPPSITGFTLTSQQQAISGIGLDCGGVPCCIPTAINYTNLTWTAPFPVICDQFSRSASNGWGTIVSGLNWAVTGGAGFAASEFAVDGSAGTVTPTSTSTRWATINNTGSSLINYDVTTRITLSGFNSTTHTGIVGRWVDPNNYVGHRIVASTATGPGNVTIRFDSVVAGVVTTTQGPTIGLVFTNTAPPSYYMRAQGDGTIFRTKVWLTTEPEPTEWTQVVVSAASGTTGTVGILTALNTTDVISFDNFLAVPMGLIGSDYEIQRLDTVDNVWQTIMLASNLCTTQFKDYEARVGVTSAYRIRTVNGLNFAGQWSTVISGSIASPGVSGSTCLQLSSDTRTLIFTSNYNQAGTYNLAYVPVWDSGTPTEDFAFPEAGTVSFGRMYNRDYQVAFKPTERGGEVFSRAILVNAAAVALPRLANVRSLRDMAWQTAPYICVRDNLGDRWFASVQVPSERVQRNGRLYIAAVNITEVTNTPYPVSP